MSSWLLPLSPQAPPPHPASFSYTEEFRKTQGRRSFQSGWGETPMKMGVKKAHPKPRTQCMWPSNSWLDEGPGCQDCRAGALQAPPEVDQTAPFLPLPPLGSPLHCSHALPSPPRPPAWSHLHLAGPLSPSRTDVISLPSSLQTPRRPSPGRPRAGLRRLAGVWGP